MAVWLLAVLACSGGSSAHVASRPTTLSTPSLLTATGCTGTPVAMGDAADVLAVTATGGPDAWSVSVTVESPDTGCDRYADWWEILGVDGELLYRRILDHSHVDEQPFTRASEGNVALGGDLVVRVRAHLHPDGYGGQVLEGQLGGTFEPVDVDVDFGAALESAEPLPEECLF
jgi:hypothetical protein